MFLHLPSSFWRGISFFFQNCFTTYLIFNLYFIILFFCLQKKKNQPSTSQIDSVPRVKCPDPASLRSWRNIVARARPTRGNGGGAANSRGRATRSERRSFKAAPSHSPRDFAARFHSRHCQNFTSRANNPASYAG